MPPTLTSKLAKDDARGDGGVERFYPFNSGNGHNGIAGFPDKAGHSFTFGADNNHGGTGAIVGIEGVFATEN